MKSDPFLGNSNPDPTSSGVRHLAIIMDGNGRWAELRGRKRTWGHREGARRVEDIVSVAAERGIKVLTLYAFSTENWGRPSLEVKLLMRLLVQQLRRMDKKLLKNQIALTVQGQVDRLPDFVQAELARVERLTTVPNYRMKLNLCLSYGGRQEIVRAVQKIASDVETGRLKVEEIDECCVAQALYHPEFPDPDLLIRTAGEYRISNFLLWQIAYTELFTSPTLWPDFSSKDLDEALKEYGLRQRRFGRTTKQIEAGVDGNWSSAPTGSGELRI